MNKRWAGDDSLINEDLAPVPDSAALLRGVAALSWR